MGIFSRADPEAGDPNAKLYDLRYPDGGQYRHQGEVHQYSLAQAIRLADHVARSPGYQIYVVDPDTDVVLWAGQKATR